MDRASSLSQNPSNLEQEWKALCEDLKQTDYCPLLAREYRAAGKILDAKALSTSHCSKGEEASCIELGKTLYSEGSYGEADPYLKAACIGSNPESCEWAGLVAAGLKDQTRALNHFRRGCSAGIDSACYQLGRSLRSKGHGSEATAPLRKACDANVAGSCSELGIVLWQSGKQDAALKLFQTDCEKKVHRACRWLPLLERKLMPPAPQKKALEEKMAEKANSKAAPVQEKKD
jgi:TPR repeat protein